MPNTTYMTLLYREIISLSKDAFFIMLQKLAVVFRSIGLTWILAQLGTQSLAAGTLVLSQYAICSYLLLGTLTSVAILGAHAQGSSKKNEIAKYIRNGIFLAFILSIFVILIFLVINHYLLFLGQPKEIILLTQTYAHFLAWALLPFSFFVVLQNFLLSISKFKHVMIYSILGVIAVLFFSYVLAFGKLGFPVSGIQGVGLGSIIAFTFVTLCLMTHLLIGKSFKSYQVFKNFFHFDKYYLYELWQLGWPLGAKLAIEIGIFAVIAILIGHHSTDQLAAQQILLQFILLAGAFSDGIDQATIIRTSQAFGSNQINSIKLSANAGLIFGLIIALAFSIIFIVFSQPILTVINLNITVSITNILLSVIPLVMLFLIFDSLRIIATGLLASLKDTKFAFLVEIISFWVVGLSTGCLLSRYYSAILSYWVGLLGGIIICAVSLLLRFYSKTRSLGSSKSRPVLTA